MPQGDTIRLNSQTADFNSLLQVFSRNPAYIQIEPERQDLLEALNILLAGGTPEQAHLKYQKVRMGLV